MARDNSLWRYKCFEKAPSAATVNATRPNALAALTGALEGLSISGPQTQANEWGDMARSRVVHQQPRISKRAQAVQEWDGCPAGENVDWYSEYIGRYAPIRAQWLANGPSEQQEIRGVAPYGGSEQAVGCLEDGSICVWDIRERAEGRRMFREAGRSGPAALFADHLARGEGSKRSRNLSFTGVVDCVNVDSQRHKAYIAVEDILNEVDLNTLEVVSQNKYAWPITALSQASQLDLPLTVGTTWSLHLYDPRVPLRDRSRSPDDLLRKEPGEPEESIAFLYMKPYPPPRAPGLRSLAPLPAPQLPITAHLFDSARRRPRPAVRTDLSDYARIEPGPLSILHHGPDEILIAGRFPSILSYDRRYFPRLQYAIHSGARLSSLTSLPSPPAGAPVGTGVEATLVACGEYGGRGSLELYSLPYSKRDPTPLSPGSYPPDSPPDHTLADEKVALPPAIQGNDQPYNYKNRQQASSSKLLSVATQGTRIVFSDAEGGLKWVERDGRGLARRWNINTWQVNERGGSVIGEQVVRKIVPLETAHSARGTRGDGDLLIWTGEKIGIVTTKPQWTDHDELVNAFEEKMDLSEKENQKMAEEYSRAMRRALERQADERRWISRFGLKFR